VRVVALVVIGLALASASAHAQSEKAAAEAAFRKGKELLASGDTARACAAFEDSEKLDPQLGTQYNLALCYEKQGKLTSAWINYSEVAAKDAKGGRRDDSARRAKALEPRLAHLAISVTAPVEGESVRIGALDVSVLAGSPSPIDEGSYEVVASAPGFVRWHGHVDVTGEGRTITVDVPALARGDVELPLPPTEAPHPAHGRKIAGLAIAGAGVLAIGAGLWLGHDVFDLRDQAIADCGGDLASCNDVGTAQTKIDDARAKAIASDVAIGVGAAALIGGVILYATAPRAREGEVVPVIGPDRVGVAFAAHF
jgi:hypothetical protein